jgi:predicted patatin/cPLA2 family phospholipase
MKTLSLNGGGSKGYMSLYILARLEEAFDNKYKPYQLFDIIGGVSTGSIIGALLAKGYSAHESLELYRKFIPKIFDNKRCFVSSLIKSKYKRDALVDLSKEYLDFDISTSKTRFMAYAVSIGEGEVRPKFWKSWKDNIKAYDVCLASSAAPTYFDPYKIDDKYYIDGGMASNNPSMCVLAEALRFGSSIENLYNVNITCGVMNGYKKPQKIQGMVDWITKITDVSMYAASGTEEYQAHTLIGFRNHYIQPIANFPLDTQNFSGMEAAAETVWQQHKDALIENIAPDR